MRDSSQPSPCRLGCTSRVPAQLATESLCVLHFTLSIERNCAEMHRQIALGEETAKRRAEVAIYIDESALLLARLTSNLCLRDDLKRRVLSTFLSLMNLRENLERATSRIELGLQAQKSSVAPANASASYPT